MAVLRFINAPSTLWARGLVACYLRGTLGYRLNEVMTAVVGVIGGSNGNRGVKGSVCDWGLWKFWTLVIVWGKSEARADIFPHECILQEMNVLP